MIMPMSAMLRRRLGPYERQVSYAGVGGFCALTHNAMMIVGDIAGQSYVPMTVLSFVVMTPLGYLLHTQFTFRQRPSARTFMRFASGAALAFPIYFLSMTLFCSGFGIAVALAAPMSTLTLMLWNYVYAHWTIAGRVGSLPK